MHRKYLVSKKHDVENNNVKSTSLDSDSTNSSVCDELTHELTEAGSLETLSASNESNGIHMCDAPKEHVVVETPVITFEEVFTFNSPPISPCPNMSSQASPLAFNVHPHHFVTHPILPLDPSLNTSVQLKLSPCESIHDEVKEVLKGVINDVIAKELQRLESSADQKSSIEVQKIEPNSVQDKLHDKSSQNNSTQNFIKRRSECEELADDLSQLCEDAKRFQAQLAQSTLVDETSELVMHTLCAQGVLRKVGFILPQTTEYADFDVAVVAQPKLSQVQIACSDEASQNNEVLLVLQELIDTVDEISRNSNGLNPGLSHDGSSVTNKCSNNIVEQSHECGITLEIKNCDEKTKITESTKCPGMEYQGPNDVLFRLMDNLLAQVVDVAERDGDGDNKVTDYNNHATSIQDAHSIKVKETGYFNEDAFVVKSIEKIDSKTLPIAHEDDHPLIDHDNISEDENMPQTGVKIMMNITCDSSYISLSEVEDFTFHGCSDDEEGSVNSCLSADELFESMETCLEDDQEYFADFQEENAKTKDLCKNESPQVGSKVDELLSTNEKVNCFKGL